MTKRFAAGTFLNVRKSESPGLVEKTFRFSQEAPAAETLKRVHDAYVGHISGVIDVPKTTMNLQTRKDGRVDVSITQPDLRADGGMTLSEFLRTGVASTVFAFNLALSSTLLVYRHAASLRAKGVKIGLESNPNNWMITHTPSGALKATFFDTTPPLLVENGKLEVGVLVPKDNPNGIGPLLSILAHSRLTSKLAAKVMLDYAFDWPTTIRTFLIKSIDVVPHMKSTLIERTRDVVRQMVPSDEQGAFMKKLTWFSVNLELLKLRAFKLIDYLGARLSRTPAEGE